MADQDGCEFESIEIGITEDDRDLRNVQERGAVDFISKKLLGFMFCLGLFWAGAALTLFFTKDFHENQCIFPLDLMCMNISSFSLLFRFLQFFGIQRKKKCILMQ